MNFIKEARAVMLVALLSPVEVVSAVQRAGNTEGRAGGQEVGTGMAKASSWPWRLSVRPCGWRCSRL